MTSPPQRHAPGTPLGHVASPRDRDRAERLAAEWARVLELEGWPPDEAQRRARQAYGLAPQSQAPQPDSSGPTLSRRWRLAYREEIAASRPGEESPTKSEALKRKELRRKGRAA